MSKLNTSLEFSEAEKKQLDEMMGVERTIEKKVRYAIHIAESGGDGLVDRLVDLVKLAEDTAFVKGWNAAIDELPEKLDGSVEVEYD